MRSASYKSSHQLNVRATACNNMERFSAPKLYHATKQGGVTPQASTEQANPKNCITCCSPSTKESMDIYATLCTGSCTERMAWIPPKKKTLKTSLFNIRMHLISLEVLKVKQTWQFKRGVKQLTG